MWSGRSPGPWMQALHSVYNLGMLLSPIVAQPFLSNSHGLEQNLTVSGNETLELNGKAYKKHLNIRFPD